MKFKLYHFLAVLAVFCLILLPKPALAAENKLTADTGRWLGPNNIEYANSTYVRQVIGSDVVFIKHDEVADYKNGCSGTTGRVFVILGPLGPGDSLVKGSQYESAGGCRKDSNERWITLSNVELGHAKFIYTDNNTIASTRFATLEERGTYRFDQAETDKLGRLGIHTRAFTREGVTTVCKPQVQVTAEGRGTFERYDSRSTDCIATTQRQVAIATNIAPSDGSSQSDIPGGGTTPPAGQPGGQGTQDPNQPSCDAGAMTWLICDMLIGYLEKAVQGINSNIITPLLDMDPIQQYDPSGQETVMFQVWDTLKNMANIALIPLFLFFIFGQTLGLDAYTVKKTLPRLVIAIIGLQFSFFLAAIISDFTNVLGKGIGDLLFGITGGGTIDFSGVGQQVSTTLTTAVLAGATASLFLTGAWLTVLAAAFFAVMSVVLTLIFRQVLIVLLVVISPFAFVAWVLPNTQGLFKKWWSIFTKTLLMYPLIQILFSVAGIFGAIASEIDAGGALAPIITVLATATPIGMLPATFKMAGAGVAAIAGGVAKMTSGVKGATYGDKKDPNSWIAQQRNLQARRKSEYKSGLKGGVSGTLGRALMNPLSYAPAATPLLGRAGARSRGLILAQSKQQRAAVGEFLEKNNISNDKVLRGLVQHGGSARALHKYINEEIRPKDAALARSFEEMLPFAGKALQGAAFSKLNSTGKAEISDYQTAAKQLGGNVAYLDDSFFAGSGAAGKAGRPDLKGVKQAKDLYKLSDPTEMYNKARSLGMDDWTHASATALRRFAGVTAEQEKAAKDAWVAAGNPESAFDANTLVTFNANDPNNVLARMAAAPAGSADRQVLEHLLGPFVTLKADQLDALTRATGMTPQRRRNNP